jgi:hypothetical protein
MKKLYIVSILLKWSIVNIMLFSTNALAQTEVPDSSLTVTDSLLSSFDVPVNGLYGGLGYGSNMIYLGSSISGNQPFAYTAITYGYRAKLYASVSALHMSGFRPFAALYTGSLTYNHTFNTWFDVSAGLYGYHVAPTLTDTLFSDFAYSDITVGVDWRVLYSKITAGGILVSGSHPYFQIRNSRYFQTSDILGGKATLSFDPYVNMILGTTVTSESSSGTETIASTFPPRKTGGGGSQINPGTIYTNSFGIMELDFGLPISLNFDQFSIEVEGGYILPIGTYTGSSARGFLLMISGFITLL